jgi:integrase
VVAVGHLEDRWYKRGPDDKRVPTARNGFGRRWRVRYIDADGRERGRSFDRKGDAERFKIQVEADLLRGTYLDPAAGKVTLRRYAQEWERGWHQDSTRGEQIRLQLRTHILPGLGGVTLAHLASRPTMIQQWLNALPVGAASAEGLFKTLSQILAAAVDDGRIPRNPCQAPSIRKPRQPKQKVIPWTAEQVAAVRAALPARYQAVVDCGAGLGMRLGEILAFGPDEADFLRHKAHVRRQVKRQGGRLWFALPKGSKERDAPMPERTALALAAHLAEFPAVDVTLPWNEPGSRKHGQLVTFQLMFTPVTRPGAVNESTFNTAVWRPARRAAGIPRDPYRDGVHALRHYYASVLLAGGVDVRTLSEYLGHHSPKVTLDVYTHLIPSQEDRALRVIEEALASQDHGPATARDA